MNYNQFQTHTHDKQDTKYRINYILNLKFRGCNKLNTIISKVTN